MKRILLIAVVGVVLLSCAGMFSKFGKNATAPTRYDSSTDAAKPASPLPPKTPAAVVEARPALAPAAKPNVKVIPGMTPADVYGNLAEKGFTKAGPSKVGGDAYWKLTSKDAAGENVVGVYGPDASSVRLIDVLSLSFTHADPDAAARDFLGYVATLPYDGADPAKARAWIEQNISQQQATTTIGGVTFALGHKARAYTLRIEPAR